FKIIIYMDWIADEPLVAYVILFSVEQFYNFFPVQVKSQSGIPAKILFVHVYRIQAQFHAFIICTSNVFQNLIKACINGKQPKHDEIKSIGIVYFKIAIDPSAPKP